VTTSERITPADLESKMRELQGEVTETTETAKSYALAAAAAVAVVVFVVAFTMGKKRGRKRSTVVEIRRI
jgi:adenylate kinase